MTTNAHTHCPTCIADATETIREGMIEVIADDNDLDWDDAARRVSDADVAAAVIAYLDQLIAEAKETRSTLQGYTCFFAHTSHL